MRFLDASPHELALRRAALGMHASAAVLRALGRVLPRAVQARWALFVSNYAHWSAERERLEPDDWDRVTRGVPVLLYHAFGDDNDRYVVSRTAFARQLRMLALLRFRVRPYAEIARMLRDGRVPPPRTVALTFDDGYADNADVAVPLLERHGFPATIFLVSARLGADNDWTEEPPLRGRALLSAEQLAPLRSHRVDFGAHTRTHPDLTVSDAATDEVASSRTELEAALGLSVPTFAYPYGRVDDRAVAAVRDAGFESACTTDPRLAQVGDDPLRVPRVEIKRDDSLFTFLRKVWFGGA
ncbi:MAG TPA: polysaccharide deacetylase family protein [Gaiellaceae bacterium]